MLLVASERAASEHGLEPLARVVARAAAGVEPRRMGIGPGPGDAARRSTRAGWKLDDLDVVELNEAFAAQALAVHRASSASTRAEVNRNGGAIALGHPLGCSGARIATTLVHQLAASRRPARAGDDVHRRRPGHRHAVRGV